MKFRVERDALGEAVAWVARALPARPVVPVLSGMLLEAAGDGLTLSCFDYDVSARLRIEAKVEEPGTELVPGRLLTEITRSLPAGPVEFASGAEGLTLACASAEFTLVSLPVEEYPALPEPPAAAGSIDGGVLAAAAAQVVPAASRDDTLPMLTAVCLDVDGGKLTLAATDRYRLAVREAAWSPADPGLRAAALVPARVLADVGRTMTPGTPVTIAFAVGEPGGAGGARAGGGTRAGGAAAGARGDADPPRPAEGMISFEGAGHRLTARLVGGEFIRYRSRFPGEFGCRADLPAVSFTEAVRRVSLVAERSSPVSLTFGAGSVVIEARTEGRARAVETVRAHFDGEERSISFNPRYLLDGVTAAAVAPGTPPQPATEAAGAEAAGADAAGASAPGAPGAPGPATGVPVAGPGRIRLEFTSPAKPAMITWAPAEVPGRTGEPGSTPEPGGGGETAPQQAFRYLVVPLRIQPRA